MSDSLNHLCLFPLYFLGTEKGKGKGGHRRGLSEPVVWMDFVCRVRNHVHTRRVAFEYYNYTYITSLITLYDVIYVWGQDSTKVFVNKLEPDKNCMSMSP